MGRMAGRRPPRGRRSRAGCAGRGADPLGERARRRPRSRRGRDRRRPGVEGPCDGRPAGRVVPQSPGAGARRLPRGDVRRAPAGVARGSCGVRGRSDRARDDLVRAVLRPDHGERTDRTRASDVHRSRRDRDRCGRTPLDPAVARVAQPGRAGAGAAPGRGIQRGARLPCAVAGRSAPHRPGSGHDRALGRGRRDRRAVRRAGCRARCAARERRPRGRHRGGGEPARGVPRALRGRARRRRALPRLGGRRIRRRAPRARAAGHTGRV